MIDIHVHTFRKMFKSLMLLIQKVLEHLVHDNTCTIYEQHSFEKKKWIETDITLIKDEVE